MLVNHLVLNLHAFDTRGNFSSITKPDFILSGQFAEDKFLGPIGAPLEGSSMDGTGSYDTSGWSELGEDGHEDSDSVPPETVSETV